MKKGVYFSLFVIILFLSFFSLFVTSNKKVNAADTTAPIWYTDDIDTVESGQQLTFQLTDDIEIRGYSSAYVYYNYGWSTSSSTKPTQPLPFFSFETKTLVSFTITAPVVSKNTTYYLWIDEVGRDSSGNVSTYEGKTPYYYSSSSYLNKLKYQYTVTPSTFNSNTSATCGDTVLSSSLTYRRKYCSLIISNSSGLSSYSISGNKTVLTTSIEGTSFTYNYLTEGLYTIVVEDVLNKKAIFNIAVDDSIPSIYTLGNGTSLSSGYLSSSYTACNDECNTLSLYDNYGLSSYEFVDRDTNESVYYADISNDYTCDVIFAHDSECRYGLDYSSIREGNYTIYVTDKVGNKNDFKFTIDRTPPKIIMKDVDSIASGEEIEFQVKDELSGVSMYIYYEWSETAGKSSKNVIRYTSIPQTLLSFSTQAPIVSGEQYYYLRITICRYYDNAGNIPVFEGKEPTKVTTLDNYSYYFSYYFNISIIKSIFNEATIKENGTINFVNSEINGLKEQYVNGTVTYFFGKPLIYNDCLDEAFEKYGVTINASTFFSKDIISPMGLYGEFIFYMKISAEDLETIYSQTDPFTLLGSNQVTTITFNNDSIQTDEKVITPLLNSENIVYYDLNNCNYLVSIIIIILSTFIAIEFIIIQNRKTMIKKYK